jgi:mono/diheme cytochrome c family protein
MRKIIFPKHSYHQNLLSYEITWFPNNDSTTINLAIMKRKMITTIFLVFGSAFFLGIITGFTPFQKKPWAVPDSHKSKKNPVASGAEAISAGKALWATHCKSCHGTKGLGDGSKAGQLKTEPGDFSKADFQAQTDGALFYKTMEGRDDMPSFKKKIPDTDDLWSLVHYMRTMKK